ncbi:MAG: signal peptide peptidase SppA [Deltaproteobacteria bacterium]|nr:signal peptide peptidase SppA [Deltaproteobacteria bacterium]MBW2413421.1 signal peptide peptidase SppA [Deltaproteobacteria bacterium]
MPRPLDVALRLLQNLYGLVRDAFLAPAASRMSRDWIVVRLDHGVVETPPARNWLQGFRPAPRALTSVLECLERAGDDARVRGVLLRLGSAPLGWAKVQSLARAMGELRDSGKRVVVYADSTGNAGGWLGGLADRFWMAPEGRLDLLGVKSVGPYLRGALDRFGIRPRVISAGRFKSAGEVLSRQGMSESAREALEPVVDELYGALVGGLTASRCADEQAARKCIDEGPYLAVEAREAGLVDELVYADEIPRKLADLAGAEPEPEATDADFEKRLVADTSYLTLARPRFQWSPVLDGRREIAVVPLEGLIRSGSARALVPLLRRIERDDSVRALVVRINSPGGEPLASDQLRRALARVAKQKPVVASLADVAASGGYYVAMAANEVVAEPATLTGSIGVVLATVEVDELLEGLGVHVDGVERGRHARIYDPTRERTQEERALLKRHVEGMYKSFVAKAAEARGRSEAEIESVAAGRVWTGTQARERGLVDSLGGLDAAIERARALAGLDSGDGDVVHMNADRPALERLFGRPVLEDASPVRGAQLLCPVRLTLD